MLDIGWTELLVIGALALIVVGPRDLPKLLRTVGQTVGKIKRMAREFQRSIEDAARETDLANLKEMRELKDLKKDMGNFDFRQQAARAQSYLNQPVKAEAEQARNEAGKAAAGSAATGAAAEKTAAPQAPAAPVEPEERRPAAKDAPAPSAETPEPRQASAKG